MTAGEPSLRQEARKAQTRGRILDAARTLFARVGYNPTTIDQITHLAGVGRGTFYMHFVGKAELLQAMFVEFRDQLRPILESLGRHTTANEGQVCAWIRTYIDFLVSQAPSIRAMWAASHVGIGGIFAREQWHALALEAFGTHIPAFRIAAQGCDPVVTARAQLILFQLEGFATACALDGWNLEVDATVSELAKTFLAFIAHTEPRFRLASRPHSQDMPDRRPRHAEGGQQLRVPSSGNQ